MSLNKNRCYKVHTTTNKRTESDIWLQIPSERNGENNRIETDLWIRTDQNNVWNTWSIPPTIEALYLYASSMWAYDGQLQEYMYYY